MMMRLTPEHLPSVRKRLPHIARGSLVTLTSRFGLSESEWTALLSKTDHDFYVAPAFDCLVELTRVNTAQASLNFSLHGAPSPEILMTWLQRCCMAASCTKIYCFLFEWETLEAQCLEQLGFEREAVLRSHIHTRNGYQNLSVYGRLEVGR